MSTFTWKIANLDRNLADGKVTTVHYTIEARSDNEVYSAGAYGSIGVDDEITTPYADLTETQCVGWVKDALTAEKISEIEATLEAQLTEQKTPTRGSGKPF